MSNDIVKRENADDRGFLPVTDRDVEVLKKQRQLLNKFISSQLREDINGDYAVIPHTNKKTLLKPGAEKLLRLFNLGVKVRQVDKVIDKDSNFAMFTYQARVFHLRSNLVISECDGTTNSQEKKYKSRKAWRTLSNGVKEQYEEETPIYDILNTLMKMAQKRAIIGATILAVSGSDFFTQDIDDIEDAEQVGVKAATNEVKKEEPKKTKKSNGGNGKAVSGIQYDDEGNALCTCGNKLMVSKYNNDELYCVKCRSKFNKE